MQWNVEFDTPSYAESSGNVYQDHPPRPTNELISQPILLHFALYTIQTSSQLATISSDISLTSL